MKSASVPPLELTRHGIKRICESTNVSTELRDVYMVLQVIDCNLFDDNSTKKNIKARISLSDGNSKMVAMISDKAYAALIANGAVLEKWSIWSLNVGKQQVSMVSNRP